MEEVILGKMNILELFKEGGVVWLIVVFVFWFFFFMFSFRRIDRLIVFY